MKMGRATFTYEESGYFLRVKLKGDIDHHSAVAVRSGMDSLLYKVRPRRLYLDLSGVEFMDSSGLGLIMGRCALMKELGGDLVVCNPCGGVERVIKLAGLERYVRVERSVIARPEQSGQAEAVSKKGRGTKDKSRKHKVREEVLK